MKDQSKALPQAGSDCKQSKTPVMDSKGESSDNSCTLPHHKCLPASAAAPPPLSVSRDDAVGHLISSPKSLPHVLALSRDNTMSNPLAALAPSTTSPTTARGAGSSHFSQNPRAKFLVMVNIVFKCLELADKPALRDKAKKLVAECTRRNRIGDPKFTPLMDVMERRLRRLVGNVHWAQALAMLQKIDPSSNGSVTSHFQQKSSRSRF